MFRLPFLFYWPLRRTQKCRFGQYVELSITSLNQNCAAELGKWRAHTRTGIQVY